MKIKRLEQMRESQRNYHRRCQWLMKDGLFIPHVYGKDPRTALSWWDEVGFILGDRRVMVHCGILAGSTKMKSGIEPGARPEIPRSTTS